MIFATEITDPLVSLISEVDDAVEENADAGLAGFLVLLTEDGEAAEEQLAATAEEHDISDNVPLAYFEGLAGPPGHNVNPDAEVTVVLYTNRVGVHNFAFAPGEMTEEDVEEIVASIPDLL